MLFYRRFWITLAQTAKKLNQQLIEIIYIALIQAFTPPLKQESKRRLSYWLQFCIQKLAAWLSFSKILCHAIKDFHSYQTNKTIFKFGKNNFIRLPAPGWVAGLDAGRDWATFFKCL